MAQYGDYNQSGYGQNNRYNQQAGNPYAQGGNPYSQSQSSSNPYAQQSNPYAQQQSNGYGQQQQPNRYGQQQQSSGYGQQQQNPFAQQQPNLHAQQSDNTRYGRQDGQSHQQQPANPYAQQNSQDGAPGGGPTDIEMGQVNGQKRDDGFDLSIHTEAQDIVNAVNHLKTKNVPQVKLLQKRSLESTDSDQKSQTYDALATLDAETIAAFRNLVGRVDKLKKKPGSGHDQNSAKITSTGNMVKDELANYMKVQNDHRKDVREVVRRQADSAFDGQITDEQVDQLIESGQTQMYAHATTQSTRRGQAQAVLNASVIRNQDYKRLLNSITEVAQLFQDINRIIQEQHEQIKKAEEDTQKMEQNMKEGVNQQNIAVKSARAARNKKWICLGIVVAIIVVILVIVFGYLGATHQLGNK